MNFRLEALNLVTARNELLPRKVAAHQRTSVIVLGTGQDNIVDQFGHPIENSFSSGTAQEREVSRVNLLMLYALHQRPVGAVGLWLSPPSEQYQMGKVLFAASRQKENAKQIVLYDVTGPLFSRREFASMAQKLDVFSRDGYFLLEDNPWHHLRQSVPMSDKFWKGVLSDYLETQFNQDVDEMISQVQQHTPSGVRSMILAKNGVDTSLACPITIIEKAVTTDGKILHRIKECPHCHFDVKKNYPKGIPANWQCPGCGGIYLGC